MKEKEKEQHILTMKKKKTVVTHILEISMFCSFPHERNMTLYSELAFLSVLRISNQTTYSYISLKNSEMKDFLYC